MQKAEKISVILPPDMPLQLREAVAAGDYASTSEALRDAVRAWLHQRREDAERLTALRARVQRSLADPRPSLAGKEIEARLDALFAAPLRRWHMSSASAPPRSPIWKRPSPYQDRLRQKQ